MSIYSPGGRFSTSSLSAKTSAEDLDFFSTSTIIYAWAGRIIGLKFSESGLIGTIVIDSILLNIIGPDKFRFLPIEPRGVEIIKPSPYMLVKKKNLFPSIFV